MIRIYLAAMTLLFGSMTVHAQFEKNSMEFSITGMAGIEKLSGSSGSSTYALINTSIGYYLAQGLSIEPQLGFCKLKGTDPGFSVILNLSFSRHISDSLLAVYFKIGYGISNAISYGKTRFTPFAGRDSWDVHIFNAGTGLKIFVKKRIALKIELNYRSDNTKLYPGYYIWTDGRETNLSETTDFTISNIGLLFGFSVFI